MQLFSLIAVFNGSDPGTESRLLSPKRPSESDAVGATSYSIGKIQSAHEFEALATEWVALSERARARTVFQEHVFLASSWRALSKPDRRPLVLTARRRGKLVCALPVMISREGPVRVARFLGSPLAQYEDTLTDPMSCDAPEILIDALARQETADILHLRRVREDAALTAVLARVGQPLGAPDAAPVLKLDHLGTPDALLHSLSSKLRRNLLAAQRRLATVGEIRFAVVRGPAAAAALAEAIALKLEWITKTGRYARILSDPGFARVLTQLVHRAPGLIAVSRLTVDGALAATEIGLATDARYIAFLGAYASCFVAESPGSLQMFETMKWCISQGYESYDLLPPLEPYKMRWARSAVAVRDYAVPLSLRGGLYLDLWLKRARPLLTRTFQSLPLLIRRNIAQAVG
jgi:CelD/BcsL family acetyltransferase involved in cellulose biosynthesis